MSERDTVTEVEEKINTFFLMGQLKRLTTDDDMKRGIDMILSKLLNISQLALSGDSDSIVEELKSMRLIMDSCGGSCSSCSSDSCG